MTLLKRTMISPRKDGLLHGRRLEFFHHEALQEWNTPGQMDSFALIHPRRKKRKTPLYVVLHSAGHDLYSCIGCTVFRNNHDIYRTPEDFFGLYLDCRAHEVADFWWGGINAKGAGAPERKTQVQNVEKRVYATLEWVMAHYPVDPERVYICGNSMGGSGALGLGMCRGDLFAAVKVNVPAGVEHMLDRCFHSSLPITDPPVCVDYSAQNDVWSAGHERFFKTMRENRFALYAYWGDFGHANADDQMLGKNDLIHSFDWLSIRKNQAYPAFSNTSSDDPNPWEAGDLASPLPGQINAFCRWKNVSDRTNIFKMKLFLCTPETLPTSFPIPETAKTDVTLRRIQRFKILPGEEILWSFGNGKGRVQADENGVVTLQHLTLTGEEKILTLTRG